MEKDCIGDVLLKRSIVSVKNENDVKTAIFWCKGEGNILGVVFVQTDVNSQTVLGYVNIKNVTDEEENIQALVNVPVENTTICIVDEGV